MTESDVVALFKAERHNFVKFVKHQVKTDDAEDIVQQTFFIASQRISQFRGDCKLSTWVYGIATNLARTYYTKMKRATMVPEGTDEIPNYDADPFVILSAREQADVINRCFAGLDDNIRRTVLSVLEEGVSYQDAAERSGIPIGTVRSRVSRIRSLIRDQLAV